MLSRITHTTHDTAHIANCNAERSFEVGHWILPGPESVGICDRRLLDWQTGRLVGVWKNRGSRSRTRAGADREQGRELSTPRHPPAATHRASSGETRAAPTKSARDVALSEGAPIIILRPQRGRRCNQG